MDTLLSELPFAAEVNHGKSGQDQNGFGSFDYAASVTIGMVGMLALF